MKDTVISAKRKRRELLIAGCCLIVAILINICSIIHYHTPWYEVFSQIGFTVCVAVVIYVLLLIVRVLWFYCRRLFCKKS